MARCVHSKLGQFFATAIAGNDILSSALYVSGIAALFAGIYAPLVLFGVALVLFFYRSVYREVVGALPVNGGAYNALLNGTTKTFAAVAGVMTVLSYTATGVISAKTAVEYLFSFLERMHAAIPAIPASLESWVLPVVLLILLFFALLVISGVKDSAKVASAIFVFHIVTLAAFVLFGLYTIIVYGTDIWMSNVSATVGLVTRQGGLLKTLFLAFSASLLGVSGFESSANFVEEQAPGVFPKTLRNMTLGVLIFNPFIAYVTLSLLPLERIFKVKDFLLADAALEIGGLFFLGWIAIDAFLVLAGAVLTSYVGVSGLVNRMALDRCLPFKLVRENGHGAHPRIILAFFLLCASILLVTGGDLFSLAGVYTISFLSVMTFFAASNLILRVSRPDLKRSYHAPLLFVIVALISTLVGVMGNIAIDPKNTGYFLIYFLPAVFFTFSVIYRKRLYVALINIFAWSPSLRRFFQRKYREAVHDRVHVFIHHPDRLANILEYIRNNESGHRVTLVHCAHGHPGRVKEIAELVEALSRAGFFMHYDIEVEYLQKPFLPATVDEYARRNRITKNKIFIGSIHHQHVFNYEDLGGVRVIL